MITLLLIWAAISTLVTLSLCVVAKRYQHQVISSNENQSANMALSSTASSRMPVHVRLATQTAAFSA